MQNADEKWMTAARKQRAGGGCLIVLSLPFIASGVFVTFIKPVVDDESVFRYAPLLFGGVFVVAGLALVAVGIATMRAASRMQATIAGAPGQPWRWRSDWKERRADDMLAGKVAGTWVFATVWTLISSISLFFLPYALRTGEWGVFLALVFPIIGVGLLLYAAYQTLRAVKFGRSVLELDTIPCIPGRRAIFTLRAKIAEVPEAGFSATLRHVHRISTGSGSKRSTREEVQWEQLTTVPRGAVAPSNEAVRIPIQFTLPEDAHETDTTDENFVHLWRLDVGAALPGVDYASRFEVPVFQPPQ